jgi:Holliday junction DNA helicase RuvA
MISYLKGIVAAKKPPELILDVNGVGYGLTASMNTFYNLPEVGDSVQVHTHLVVREDSHTLFGFKTEKERALFLTLIKVNGVGPKLAITILSSIDPNSFVQCIQANDTASLVQLPGVGKKTAERLVLDLRDRLKDWQGDFSFTTDKSNIAVDPKQDAESALIALGYKPQEAKRALDNVNAEGESSETLIRMGLKNLVR